MERKTRQDHIGGPPLICGHQNVRAAARDYTPNPRTEIEVPGPDGNRTRAARLKGRDSIDYATATDSAVLRLKNN